MSRGCEAYDVGSEEERRFAGFGKAHGKVGTARIPPTSFWPPRNSKHTPLWGEQGSAWTRSNDAKGRETHVLPIELKLVVRDGIKLLHEGQESSEKVVGGRNVEEGRERHSQDREARCSGHAHLSPGTTPSGSIETNGPCFHSRVVERSGEVLLAQENGLVPGKIHVASAGAPGRARE